MHQTLTTTPPQHHPNHQHQQQLPPLLEEAEEEEEEESAAETYNPTEVVEEAEEVSVENVMEKISRILENLKIIKTHLKTNNRSSGSGSGGSGSSGKSSSGGGGINNSRHTTGNGDGRNKINKSAKLELEFNSILAEELMNFPIPIEQPCKHKFVLLETQTRRGDEIENETAVCILCGYSKNS